MRTLLSLNTMRNANVKAYLTAFGLRLTHLGCLCQLWDVKLRLSSKNSSNSMTTEWNSSSMTTLRMVSLKWYKLNLLKWSWPTKIPFFLPSVTMLRDWTRWMIKLDGLHKQQACMVSTHSNALLRWFIRRLDKLDNGNSRQYWDKSTSTWCLGLKINWGCYHTWRFISLV